MRTRFCAYLMVMLSMCAALCAETFDTAAETQILDVLRSEKFANAKIDYQFEEQIYPLYIIHNPQNEMLWTEGFSDTENWTLALVGNLPLELVAHLKDLIPSIKSEKNSYVDLRGAGEIEPKLFSELKPIYVAKEIVDPQTDAQVKEAFSSKVFVNKVFHYELKGEPYKVRILHNPQGLKLSAKRAFSVDGGPQRGYSISWDYRYGIIVDYEAPQALIDHLSKLTNASWWNWYYNFQIHNGTEVTFQKKESGILTTLTTTYYLDSWFNFTSDLK